jgi:hemoglobin
MDAPQSKLFDDVGDHAAITAAVDGFYRRVAEDPRVAHFFQNADMERQRRKLRVFLTILLTGKAEFAERYLADAHKQLVKAEELNDTHFNVVTEHLAATLEELDVPSATRDQLLMLIESLRDAVLGRNHA